jgi:hypothetical protein
MVEEEVTLERDDHDALWDEYEKNQAQIRKEEREHALQRESNERLARLGLRGSGGSAGCVHCGQPLIFAASAGDHGICDYCLHRD